MTIGTPFIVRYKVRDNAPGRPLGELILSDRKTYAVWDDAVHQECCRLYQHGPVPVTIKTRRSASGNVYLTAIATTLTDYELYDLARQRDTEKNGVGIKGYLADRIAKGNRAVAPESIPTASVDITQVNTMPPSDHDSLMKRVG